MCVTIHLSFSNSLQPFHQRLLHPIKRSTSRLDTSSDQEQQWTRWRSSSCFHEKTSRFLIRCSGGLDIVHSLLTCLALPMTFFLCQVCFKFLQACLRLLLFFRLCHCCWADLLRRKGHNLTSQSKFETRHNLHLNACQTTPLSGSWSHPGHCWTLVL